MVIKFEKHAKGLWFLICFIYYMFTVSKQRSSTRKGLHPLNESQMNDSKGIADAIAKTDETKKLCRRK